MTTDTVKAPTSPLLRIGLALAAVVIVVALLATCGESSPIEQLHGTWANTLVTYGFDTAANTMTLTVSGTTETKPYTLVSQADTHVIIRVDGDSEPMTITFDEENVVTITQPGALRMQVLRQ